MSKQGPVDGSNRELWLKRSHQAKGVAPYPQYHAIDLDLNPPSVRGPDSLRRSTMEEGVVQDAEHDEIQATITSAPAD